MPLDAAKNFALVTVSGGNTDLSTSIALAAGNGTKLPTPPFNLVWWNASDYSNPSDDPFVEIVRCTSKNVDLIEVVRAQEGTTATAKNLTGKTYKMHAGFFAAAAMSVATLSDIKRAREYALEELMVFDGMTTTFEDVIPTQPDLVSPNTASVILGGEGLLQRKTDAGDPVPGQFKLFGATNQSIQFGRAPAPTDYGRLSYVDA